MLPTERHRAESLTFHRLGRLQRLGRRRVGLVVAAAELTDIPVPPHVRLAFVRDARAVAHAPRGDGHDNLAVEACDEQNGSRQSNSPYGNT